jgi:hypothetical protein
MPARFYVLIVCDPSQVAWGNFSRRDAVDRNWYVDGRLPLLFTLEL